MSATTPPLGEVSLTPERPAEPPPQCRVQSGRLMPAVLLIVIGTLFLISSLVTPRR
jgi:hypothetical protein